MRVYGCVSMFTCAPASVDVCMYECRCVCFSYIRLLFSNITHLLFFSAVIYSSSMGWGEELWVREGTREMGAGRIHVNKTSDKL